MVPRYLVGVAILGKITNVSLLYLVLLKWNIGDNFPKIVRCSCYSCVIDVWLAFSHLFSALVTACDLVPWQCASFLWKSNLCLSKVFTIVMHCVTDIQISKFFASNPSLYVKLVNFKKWSISASCIWTIFIFRVNGLPSSLPEIDWAYYKRMVPNAAIVADFEKKVRAVIFLFFAGNIRLCSVIQHALSYRKNHT